MFQNKTVWITGGASGMGLLSGQCFAEQGAKVALTDINAPALEAAVRSITEKGGQAIGIPVDVTQYEQITAARDQIVQTFGSIDILIPFAGGAEVRLLKEKNEFKDQDISVFDFGIDLNLKGAVYAAHAALAQMAKQMSGVIIFIGSISGVEASGNSIAYSAAKSALINGDPLPGPVRRPIQRAHLLCFTRSCFNTGGNGKHGHHYEPGGRAPGDRRPDPIPGLGQSVLYYRL